MRRRRAGLGAIGCAGNVHFNLALTFVAKPIRRMRGMDQTLSIQLDAGSSEACAILHLSGPVTLQTFFALQSELRAQTAALVVLDLAGVPYVDSAGLGCFVNAHVSAQRRNGKLVLAGVNDKVQSLVEMTRLSQVLEVKPDWQSAAGAGAK